MIDEVKNKQQEKFKVIIFSTFLDTCEYLKRRLVERDKVWTITGKDTPKNVEKAKKEIEKVYSGILICSDAAKEGHNLQFCNYMIHYDFPFTPAALQQRNGRIYRKGQKEQPEVYYMFVEDSYDERVFGEIIAEKSNKIKGLAGDNLICDRNVLPSDAEELLKKCFEKYWDERIVKSKMTYNDILEKIQLNNEEGSSSRTKFMWVKQRFQLEFGKEEKWKDYLKEYFVENFSEDFKDFNGTLSEELLSDDKVFKFISSNWDETLEKEVNNYWKEHNEKFITVLSNYRNIGFVDQNQTGQSYIPLHNSEIHYF